MGKILVIVESPGKTGKLEKIMGGKYKVLASVGHIIDLPVGNKTSDGKKLSVDVNNNFKPAYEVLPRKDKVVKELKAAAKNADDIIIATDEDREGEMIAWSIAYVLKLKDPKRMVFNSITKTAIDDAVKKIGGIDYRMVDAQKARRILDRIVGYDTSKLLWSYMPSAKSAGRVQSVVVRLIAEKEKEVNDFIKNKMKDYFKFNGNFYLTQEDKKNDACLKAVLCEVTKVDKKTIHGKIAKVLGVETAREVHKKCTEGKYKIFDIQKKKSTRNPPAPFTTSTMQQEASRKLGMSIQRTMTAAQKLYENGKITYLRTDSVNLSDDAMKNIKEYIIKKYGAKHYREMKYKQKKGNTQEAHEAVRPTNVDVLDPQSTNNDETRLYSLIWKRTIASQMKPAEFDVVTIVIKANNFSSYYFQSTMQTLVYAGYLQVYNIVNVQDKEDEEDNDSTYFKGKEPKVGDRVYPFVIDGKQEFDKPPSRFSEASLVAKLDPKELNIGRPATLQALVSKIQERNYVTITDIEGIKKEIIELQWKEGCVIKEKISETNIGAENKKFVPTHLGIAVTDFMMKNFADIMDYKFTAKMEQKLDDVAEGTLVWTDVLQEFYDKFEPIVSAVKQLGATKVDETMKKIGKDPSTGGTIYGLQAKHGPMIKLIKDDKVLNEGPIKAPLTLDSITLKDAIEILKYPIILGKIGNATVKLYDGKHSPFVNISGKKIGVPSLDVTLEEVKKILAEKDKNLLFTHEGKEYRLMDSKYGDSKHYIMILDKKKNKRINVKISDDVDPWKLTAEEINDMVTNKYKNKFKKNDKDDKKQTGGKLVKKPVKKGSKKPVKKATKKPVKKAVKK